MLPIYSIFGLFVVDVVIIFVDGNCWLGILSALSPSRKTARKQRYFRPHRANRAIPVPLTGEHSAPVPPRRAGLGPRRAQEHGRLELCEAAV